jgi:CHASE2 domain-containing sensor protein
MRRQGGTGVTSRAVALLVAALVAIVAGGIADFAHFLPGLEQDSISQRFAQRGARPAPGLLVVAIDEKSFDDLKLQWPFPRSRHAQAIDRLAGDGARAIVYDVQFTEPTRPREDGALAAAVARAGNVVLATSETDEHGHTNILGGDDVLAQLGAHAGASNLPPGPGGVLQRFEPESGGLQTLAIAAARVVGRAPDPSAFDRGGAWIDFRGPPGTIDTVSFSDLVLGRVSPSRVRGRIVVIGAAAATLQDVHPTPTASDRLMSGPEIEANTIYTAVHGLPLRDVPRWVDLLAVALLGLLPALASLRLRALLSALLAPGVGVAWVVAAQVAFDHGHVLAVAAPLFALAVGTVLTIGAGYVSERRRRKGVAQRNEALEGAVRERTAELRDTQLEIIHRLAVVTESRDEETGLHLERIGRLCERLGLALGMTEAEAETLRHASLLHDVGKVAVPDAILTKPGPLTDEEWAVMRRHAAEGAGMLAGSRAPVMRMAEEIALTHHERWDGTGYPNGLTGDAIPLAGRICAVCDVFDALRSRRPYKEPWPLQDALDELARERGRHFDPVVLDAFLDMVDDLDPVLLAAHETPQVPASRAPRARDALLS